MIAPETVRPASSSIRLARPKSVTWVWPCAIQEDIGGLQVAVEDAPLVGVADRVGNFGDDPRRDPGVFREFSQLLIQPLAFD